MIVDNKIIKYIKNSCLLLALILVSCSDYLDTNIYGEPLLESFYKTPEDAERAVIAAYTPMREMYGRENFIASTSNDLLFGDIGTDDLLKGGARASDGPQLYEKELYNLTSSNKSVENIWKVNFKGVYFANLVLEKVPEIAFEDEARKKEIIAEAYFLRAYYYFDLVNTFGGVPLITEPLEVGEFNVPRTTQEAIYTLIEDDLKIAIPALPSRFDKGTDYLGHADKGAALGLMMRVSLYQNKMEQVKTYGDQLFTLSYKLEDDYGSIFNSVGEWGSGSIFEVNYSTNSDNLGGRMPHMMAPRSKGGIGFGQVKDDLRNEFEANDPRLDASFYNVTGGYGTEWFVRKYAWAPYTDYAIPSVGGKGNNANNIRIIRLSDAYLMYAEAIYNTDPGTAVEYVNKVRKRARGANAITVVPDLPAALSGQPLLDAIYHERRVELAGEGFRFHDLIRTNRAETILAPLGFQKNKHEIMPIPLSQISLSQGVLVQNNY
ncbi:RagB/SusD family nutrient uptake outer membrane protein [Polaribacter sp. Q13]|uniref:RagB/SusD family nutrient uptake outer membrane protein n=1 Tax=Polaribacter sp. Q13 TaxID=2806551 RepID=UPI00193B84B7|nr:RagB/SusD family nutrient uptake outer membrane protein [Polaribacter sp. Q13]QVY64481.1 RagB/SusD family nutrient uptake outer membrane protein [Polaribacter sp. Q13]